MFDQAGKICPYCNNGFFTGEEIVRCPDCLTPEHKKCREHNNACPVCGSSRPCDIIPPETDAVLCAKCGRQLNPDQAFCPMCGSPKAPPAPLPRRCGNCGADVGEGDLFCPKCGQKMAPADVQSSPSAIEQYNTGILKKKKNNNKRKRLLSAIIAAMVLVFGVGGCLTYAALQRHNRILKQEALEKVHYIENVNNFMNYTFNSADHLFGIDQEIKYEWNNSIIYPDRSISSDQAISSALIKETGNIESAGNDKIKINSLYKQIETPPFKDTKMNKISVAVSDFYNSYCAAFQTDLYPSGTFNSYMADTNAKDSFFMSKYDELNSQLHTGG
jgi:RNA polymerase subunit RPABC4/transcription elongation factor Spt4